MLLAHTGRDKAQKSRKETIDNISYSCIIEIEAQKTFDINIDIKTLKFGFSDSKYMNTLRPNGRKESHHAKPWNDCRSFRLVGGVW